LAHIGANDEIVWWLPHIVEVDSVAGALISDGLERHL
jgi:hypothetical protein